MQRVTEPELMEDAEQAEIYAGADFSEANTLFIQTLLTHMPVLDGLNILDIGCGPGDICLTLADQFPDARIYGVDGSEAMLNIARRQVNPRGNAPQFLRYTLPDHELPTVFFDVILSNSMLHHLHHPQVLWQSIIQLARPGCRICVMDLFRPDSTELAQAIVNRYAADEHEILRRDFYHSLLAAFRPTEVEQQLQEASLSQLQTSIISDRHLLVAGHL